MLNYVKIPSVVLYSDFHVHNWDDLIYTEKLISIDCCTHCKINIIRTITHYVDKSKSFVVATTQWDGIDLIYINCWTDIIPNNVECERFLTDHTCWGERISQFAKLINANWHLTLSERVAKWNYKKFTTKSNIVLQKPTFFTL